MLNLRRSLVPAVALFAATLGTFPAPVRAETIAEAAEAQLRAVFETVQQGRMGAALEEVDRLIARYPNFRLAHLVRGDLLLARTGPLAGFGNTGHAGRERLEELRTEALARLRAYSDRVPEQGIPRQLLKLGPSQQHAIVVEVPRLRNDLVHIGRAVDIFDEVGIREC